MQSAGLHAYVDVSSRDCKIVYSRTAAVALTLRDATRPRIGSETSSSQASATRGRSPFPSAPSTSTTPPDQSGAVYGVFAPAAAPQHQQPAVLASARKAARVRPRAAGRCPTAPADALHPAAVPSAARRSGITTPVAPDASAVRQMAPRFCGSV